MASWNFSPSVIFFATLSDPAKSTNYNLVLELISNVSIIWVLIYLLISVLLRIFIISQKSLINNIYRLVNSSVIRFVFKSLI